jgi:eukaryotic-like serine/threonine-protein kinase
MVGQQLGPYRVLEKLGEGGMGEVYKACDTRLDRIVAIKILPAHLSSDPAARARFEREARAISHLNDPRICTLHDIGSEGETDFLVMEYLEGQTLAARIEKGPLPMADVLRCGREIAHALDRAHRAGIVHRDLKPANVMLVGGGSRQTPAQVKLMDFGLARGVELGGAAPAVTEVATMARPVTADGTIVGTLNYMAPEQLEGRETDARTDVWALGCVLYEMATRKRPFSGDSQASLVAAIMDREPPAITDLQPLSLSALEHVVSRCLAKDPADRWQSARDVAHELEWMAKASSALAAPPTGPKRSRKRRWPALAAAVILAAALGAGLFFAGRASTPLPQPLKFTRLTFQRGRVTGARFTRDAKDVIYAASWEGRSPELYETRADGTAPSQTPKRSGVSLLSIAADGELALIERPEWASGFGDRGRLLQVKAFEESPKPGPADVRSADYSPFGKTLAIVRRVEGEDRLEMPPGNVLLKTAGVYTGVRVSPDGGRIALSEHPAGESDARGSIVVVDVASRKPTRTKQFSDARGTVAWSRDGREIWYSASSDDTRNRLNTVRADSLTEGTPIRTIDFPVSGILCDVASDGRVLAVFQRTQGGIRARSPGDDHERELGWLDFSVPSAFSADGTALLLWDSGDSGGPNYRAYLRDLKGSPPMPLDEGSPKALSQDGRWALATRSRPREQLVLIPIGSAASGESVVLPPGPLETYQTADFVAATGKVVLVGAERGRPSRTWVQDVSSGQPRQVTEEGTVGTVTDPNGRFVAALTSNQRLVIVPLAGGAPRDLGTVARDERICQWSEDGSTLYLYRVGVRLEVVAVDARTGLRKPWKTFELPDPAGALFYNLVMTRDARSYAYGYIRRLDELYVVQGLK